LGLLLLCVTLAAVSTTIPKVEAASAYKTYTLNRYGYLVETNEAYEAVDMIRTFGPNLTFSGAKDLFIDDDDYLYVADTGNRRIVVFDDQGQYLYHFGSDVLKKPTGIYVRDDSIYVADYGTALSNEDIGAIYRYRIDKSETDVQNAITLEATLSTPTSELLETDQFVFRPLKIAVDAKQTMYLVAEGVTNGVLMVDSTNRFINYFASNSVQISLWERFERYFYGNNPDVTLTKNIPPSVYNVAIDPEGYFYTVTQSSAQQGDNLKKVNLGGVNYYPTDMFIFADPVDAWPGKVKNSYVVTAGGNILEYDSMGNLLFKFGGLGVGNDKLGLFLSASAIAVDSTNQIYVMDDHASRNSIQIFRPTEFASVVHEALDLYNRADYASSIVVWESVLRYNSMLDMAYRGIGLGHLMNKDYKEAMEYFRIADDRVGYSDGFWEIRNAWMTRSFETIVIALVLLVVLGVLFRRTKVGAQWSAVAGDAWHSVWKRPRLAQFALLFRFMKHPSDTVYEVKAHHRIEPLTAWIALFLLFGVYVASLVFSGFIFNPIVLEDTILFNEAMKILLPVLLFVVSNYLMSSLMEGEGTLKATFVNTIGSLTPAFFLLPLAIVLSNVLTQNEGFLYYFTLSAMVGWIGVLLFFVVKETHNYSVTQTIVNLLLTLLMMVVLIVILLMVYLMVLQVSNFLVDIVKEAILRG
jgi:hypothetical protein